MEESKLAFSVGGHRLAGVLHLPDSPARGGVVSCHGMLADKDGPKHRTLAGELCRRGLAALRFDFSGRGESQGDLLDLTIEREVAECRAAMELLRSEGVEPIGLFGSSLGGTAALCAAAGGGAAALVTLSAPARMRRLLSSRAGAEGLERWRREGRALFDGQYIGYSLVEETGRLDVLARAAEVECPWLILHGGQDEVVPLEDARLLARASGATLEEIPGADHRLSAPEQLQAAIARAADFLARRLAN